MAKCIFQQEDKLDDLDVSIDNKLQKFMVTLFTKQMGNWKQELGRDVSMMQESGEYPPLLKATLLYYFFKSFDISK